MSKKEAYQKKLQAQLDEWKVDIDMLKAKAEKAEANSKSDYQKHIEELRAMQKAAREKLTELKEAGDDAWEDLKEGIEGAWHSLDKAMKSAVSRFK